VVLVAGITFLVKVVGFYKEVLVAGAYGLSELLDTFLIATIIPSLINAIFLESFKAVFIPSYISEEKTNDKIGSFQSVVFIITGLASIVLIFLSFLITDFFLTDIFPDHTQNYYSLVREQFYIIIPSVLFWGLSAVLSGILNVNKEFRYTSFSSVFIALTTIVALFSFRDLLGQYLLAIGTLAGSIISFLYLLIIAQFRGLLKLAWPDFKNSNVRVMLKQIPAKLTSSFLTGMQVVVDQFFAAQLIIGSVSALNYGIKLPSFAVSMLFIAITNVLLPHFTESVLENRQKAFRKLIRMIRTVFLSSAVVAVLGIVFSVPIIRLFFENDNFTPENTYVVAQIQQIILIYLPFRLVGLLLMTFLTSINKNNLMAFVSLIGILTNVVLNWILIKYFGIYGIAAATTFVVILKSSLLFLFMLQQKKLNI